LGDRHLSRGLGRALRHVPVWDGLLRSATIAFVILTVLGLLGTFPIFFQAFAPE
jgi:hypothetical protein